MLQCGLGITMTGISLTTSTISEVSLEINFCDTDKQGNFSVLIKFIFTFLIFPLAKAENAESRKKISTSNESKIIKTYQRANSEIKLPGKFDYQNHCFDRVRS